MKDRRPKDRMVRLEEIERVVLTISGIHSIMDRARTRSLVEARYVFFWLARTLTNKSLKEIGKFCGGYDHTTVDHGAGKIETLITTEGHGIAKTCLETLLDIGDGPYHPPRKRSELCGHCDSIDSTRLDESRGYVCAACDHRLDSMSGR